MRQAYAGNASGNNKGDFHYNQKAGFEKFKEVNHSPADNKNNIFERKLTQAMPKTRDRFISNPFTQLVNPEAKAAKYQGNSNYKTDKLDISDIKGTKVSSYEHEKYKKL